MNILNDTTLNAPTTKGETEFVEQEKQEYNLLGTFLRRPGLSLFGYDHFKDEVFLVEVKRKESIQIEVFGENLKAADTAEERCNVDSRLDYFEALNMRTAINRVNKFKQGKITQLNNLRSPEVKEIKLF